MIRAALLLLLPFVPAVIADHIEWEVLATKLPKPLSDLGVSLAPNGLVYISGGCDDPSGNVFVSDGAFFACGSVSSSFYSFDPSTGAITALPDLPQERYRHASVVTSSSMVWLVGGRNLTDSLILEVDVSWCCW